MSCPPMRKLRLEHFGRRDPDRHDRDCGRLWRLLGRLSVARARILVNVMNRQADAHIRGNGGAGTRAALRTDRGDVSVTTTQTGTIKALAGSAGIGGQAGAGGAIVVNVMSDDTGGGRSRTRRS